MKLDETTLIVVQDYINELNEKIGLKPETMKDVRKAIGKYKTELKNFRLVVDNGLACPLCESDNIYKRSGYDVCFDCGHHF